MIKMEEDVGEGRGEEAGTGRALRRRLDEGGAAVQDETRLLRAHAEAQALAIQGMEQTRVIGEQLVQAKSRIVELTAEMKNKDAVMQEKERYYCELIQSKDAVIQSKDVALQEKESHFGELIKCKDELLQSKDAEIRRLHADGGCCRRCCSSPCTRASFSSSRCSCSSRISVPAGLQVGVW